MRSVSSHPSHPSHRRPRPRPRPSPRPGRAVPGIAHQPAFPPETGLARRAVRALTGRVRARTWRTPRHCVLLAVDIAAFGDRRRDNDVQLYLRRSLYALLQESFDRARLPWRACHREDRGDGVLVVAPSRVPADALLDMLALHLRAGLRRHNKLASTTAEIRLRVAMHAGQVCFDRNGVAGHAVVRLFRLLDAPAFKRAFHTAGSDLGMVTSDYVYQEIIRQGRGLVPAGAYRRIGVCVKETRCHAWLWLSQRPSEAEAYGPTNATAGP